MKTNYNINEKGNLVIAYYPEEDMADALVIHHGEIENMDGAIGHQPALMHDLYKGVTEYELPPDFDPQKIVEVHIEEPKDETLIPKF